MNLAKRIKFVTKLFKQIEAQGLFHVNNIRHDNDLIIVEFSYCFHPDKLEIGNKVKDKEQLIEFKARTQRFVIFSLKSYLLKKGSDLNAINAI